MNASISSGISSRRSDSAGTRIGTTDSGDTGPRGTPGGNLLVPDCARGGGDDPHIDENRVAPPTRWKF
jgi:hypothetical protein